MFWNKSTFLLLAVVICSIGVLGQSPVVLLAGVSLVVFALQKLPDAPALPTTDFRPFLFYVALAIGLGGSATAAWLSAQRDFKFNTIDLVLWLASLLLVMATAIWQDRRHLLGEVQQAPLDRPRRDMFLEVGFVAFTTVVALGLRLTDLGSLPPAVHGDEGEVGMLALRILEGIEPLPLFASTIFGQNPAGFPYLMAPFLAIFGRNEVGLRILPAVMGAASVPFLYLIGRRGWGRLAGASAAWLMTISHFHIHYSRIAVPNIGTAFVVVVMIWLLFRAYRRNVVFLQESPMPPAGSPGTVPTRLGTLRLTAPLADFVALGLVLGLGQYIYHGSRLLPMIVGAACLFLLQKRKITFLQILVVGATTTVAVAPLAAFYLDHWNEFVGRSQTVFIFTEANLRHTMGANATFADDLLPYLKHQFMTTLGFITGDGDRSSFYIEDIPVFDPLTLVLLWLGFGALLTHIRRFEESVVATWFLLGIVFAGFLTIEQPNGPRVISVAPAIYLIGGIFMQRVWAVQPAFMGGQLRRIALAVVGVLALLLFYLNWRTYFVDLKGYTHAILPTVVARAVASAPDAASVYIIGDPILYAEHGTIRFLAGTENIFDLRTPAALSDPTGNQSGIFIVALEPGLDELEVIQKQYPSGDGRMYSDGQGRFLYATYYLSP
jgi:4-amino-4-deoxy-L-arabinose transferase-like glycosyltransferase